MAFSSMKAHSHFNETDKFTKGQLHFYRTGLFLKFSTTLDHIFLLCVK